MVDYTSSQFRFRGITTKFALRARAKMYESFLQTLQPTPETTIVDIGATPDAVTEDSNFLEKWYPHPERITATSIEDASYLEEAHPGVTFVQTAAGDRLPFEDRQFDIAFSSAVVEHVGDRSHQRQFISEMVRVSKRFFLTTPDRRFPMELHTFLPFLHWLPPRYHQLILRKVGKSMWASTDILNLLDEKSIRPLFPPDSSVAVDGVTLLGIRSNLVVHGSSPA